MMADDKSITPAAADKAAPQPVDLKVWRLTARNRQEPPFHFAHVAHEFIVKAAHEKAARDIAASAAGQHSAVWHDAAQTDCDELPVTGPGLVAARY